MNPQSSSKAAITLPRYDFLDGIRAFLAITVVIHHAWYTVNDYNGKGLSPCFHVMIHGHYAVCFFIILSGFCLMLPVLNNNFELLNGVGFFLRRRAWRILPPYYFALLLSLLLIATLIHNKTGAHWDISLPVTPYNIATHVFLIHNFFPDHFYKIDHVLWSVAVEFQIYFLFPILLACWRTIGAFFTTVIAVVVSSLMEMGATAFFHIGPALHFIGLFALGMSAACIGFSSSRPVFLWGMISMVTFAVFLVMTPIHAASRPFHDVLFGFFAASILIYITITPKGVLHAIFNFGIMYLTYPASRGMFSL